MRQRHSLAGFLRWILLLPILVVLPTSSSSTAPSADEEAKESFTLAVVRRDGIAIPFATYDGKRWKNSWPPPESKVTAPIMLTDVPRRWWSGLAPVAKWTFWPTEAADGEPRTLETIGPMIYPAHCQQGLGLRTTYSTREVIPPPHIQPYPKVGLAVSSGPASATRATIERIEIVDIATSPLVTPLARTLVSEVSEEEKRRIAGYIRMGEGWSHPYNEAERKETPLRIEALYKVARGLGDRDVFYFEGLKHYAIRDPESSRSKKSQAAKPEGGPGQEPCDLVTFVAGWVIGREDELLKDHALIKPKQVRVSVTSCDFAAASIMFPLGVVRVKDKALWAVQWSNWTHETYQLTEVTDDNLILAAGTTGGQCLPRQ
jgi:hypothetical protein